MAGVPYGPSAPLNGLWSIYHIGPEVYCSLSFYSKVYGVQDPYTQCCKETNLREARMAVSINGVLVVDVLITYNKNPTDRDP